VFVAAGDDDGIGRSVWELEKPAWVGGWTSDLANSSRSRKVAPSGSSPKTLGIASNSTGGWARPDHRRAVDVTQERRRDRYDRRDPRDLDILLIIGRYPSDERDTNFEPSTPYWRDYAWVTETMRWPVFNPSPIGPELGKANLDEGRPGDRPCGTFWPIRHVRHRVRLGRPLPSPKSCSGPAFRPRATRYGPDHPHRRWPRTCRLG
jgi:hypothetical protein